MTTSQTFLVDWNRRRCKGYVQTWVARPKQQLKTVAATIVTIAQKNTIASPELRAIIDEVREESVDPFFGPPHYSGSERQQRLNEMVDELRRGGVL